LDHGTPYTADGFLNQVKLWGIAPSFAAVTEPQTNGVAERFNRTLKEQVIRMVVSSRTSKRFASL
jgi:putative transposase